jgi:hypothetical protein
MFDPSGVLKVTVKRLSSVSGTNSFLAALKKNPDVKTISNVMSKIFNLMLENVYEEYVYSFVPAFQKKNLKN